MKIQVLGDEIWEPILGFPGYEVSSTGRVRSFRSINGRGELSSTPRLLKQSKAKGKKYFRVGLNDGAGKTHYRPVHILVTEAFHGIRPPNTQVRHLDGNHEHNHQNNLCWGTCQENANDRILHGTQVRGEKVSTAKLTREKANEIQNHLPNWKKGDGKKFAQKFGVGNTAISCVKTGRTW